VKRRLLSKSKYLAGLQCHKYLWLLFHDPEKVASPDASKQHIFDEGHRLGEIAKRLFPAGVDVPTGDFMGNVNRTKEMLRDSRPLFEPGFYVDSLFSRLDVLSPVDGGCWDIYEVKGSTKVKDENIHDVSFQRHCCRRAGLEIRKCFLVHVNNQYVKSGEIDPGKLLTIEEITEEVEAVAGGVPDLSEEMFRAIASPECPDVSIGPHCSEPYDCPVTSCWKEIPENTILDLYRGGQRKFELFNKGVLRLCEIPSSVKLTVTQRTQQSCDVTGLPHVDMAAIGGFVGSLQYPLHYLDFETFSPMLPIYEGTRPYQRIPFQFSLHTVETPGTGPVHHSFLADGRGDPRPEFLAELRRKLGDRGNVVVYNQTFELGVLKELAASLPEYAGWVEVVSSRVIDLYKPFRDFSYYHPLQKGSASIKSVLPALTGKSYAGLAIAKGDDASLAFFQILSGRLTEGKTGKMRSDLEEYCALDTDGMISIVDELRRICL